MSRFARNTGAGGETPRLGVSGQLTAPGVSPVPGVAGVSGLDQLVQALGAGGALASNLGQLSKEARAFDEGLATEQYRLDAVEFDTQLAEGKLNLNAEDDSDIASWIKPRTEGQSDAYRQRYESLFIMHGRKAKADRRVEVVTQARKELQQNLVDAVTGAQSADDVTRAMLAAKEQLKYTDMQAKAAVLLPAMEAAAEAGDAARVAWIRSAMGGDFVDNQRKADAALAVFGERRAADRAKAAVGNVNAAIEGGNLEIARQTIEAESRYVPDPAGFRIAQMARLDQIQNQRDKAGEQVMTDTLDTMIVDKREAADVEMMFQTLRPAMAPETQAAWSRRIEAYKANADQERDVALSENYASMVLNGRTSDEVRSMILASDASDSSKLRYIEAVNRAEEQRARDELKQRVTLQKELIASQVVGNAASSLRDAANGTGFGLAITKSVDVQLEDGSTFKMTPEEIRTAAIDERFAEIDRTVADPIRNVNTKVETIAAAGTDYGPWQQLFNNGTDAATVDYIAKNGKLPESTTAAFALYRQVKAANPAVAARHTRGTPGEMLELMSVSLDYGLASNETEAALRAVTVLTSENDSARKIGLASQIGKQVEEQIRRSDGIFFSSPITSAKNAVEIQRKLSGIARVYSAAGVPPKVAVEKAMERVMATHAPINGVLVDRRSFSLPELKNDYTAEYILDDVADQIVGKYVEKYGKKEGVDAADIALFPDNGRWTIRYVDRNSSELGFEVQTIKENESVFSHEAILELMRRNIAARNTNELNAVVEKDRQMRQYNDRNNQRLRAMWPTR